MRTLVAIPVYNEEKHVRGVLSRVLESVGHVLVIDDGSTDRTPDILAEFPVDVIRHAVNRGYGRSVADAFRWAAADGYDWVITMDCDEQHEPDRIPDFLAAQAEDDADIISGSRYLLDARFAGGEGRTLRRRLGLIAPPADRVAINRTITAELNTRFSRLIGTELTDGFCGFKSHRVCKVAQMRLTESGYALPMQLWTQAAALGMRVREIPVELIYNDPSRTFGAALDDAAVRLAHYRDVLHRELWRQRDRLPASALSGAERGCACQ